MEWEGKIAVITGASSGLGALLAQRLAERGAVPVLMARSAGKLKEAAARISGRHGVEVLDVTSSEDVSRVMNKVLAEYGRIDILINNAGYGVFDRFVDAPLEEFEGMMDVNYMGTVRCTKAVLPAMLHQGSGHIVNVASMAGKIGSAKSSGYSATKHAVLGLTNSLRQELVGTGVYLTAVNPGPIDTPFFDRADPGGGYVKNVKWFMLKPEAVVGQILKAVERRTPEINLPWVGAAGVKLFQLFPRMFDRVAFKLLNKK
ncbi:SDR family NAD(P)-dependent oxidoreductase [Paenibacillus mucilaginosus]|uniref:YqjQ n=3 Tax=Paenibacillus mucilaginosus TaxID=61624 RepID=H6NBE2_9BACL|nr:SDR family oxidoreductase [Paenibacillus mucilaginosus]AEI45143.1 YqjQ [Paenibacillus mucilaginosus KNP414]AFC32888.1 YqjQ [Paenibacillus mucilaginosus 3016]AFH65199.1 oxidoreductase [Paenibacillus mucilaginosus K02]MCG7212962.1 SDR family oxidoreductase [Paenibacillus mucilaginosus]WDM26625.1 SDR family oxidoreductase [Paenibacillus mucilaginosus]